MRVNSESACLLQVLALVFLTYSLTSSGVRLLRLHHPIISRCTFVSQGFSVVGYFGGHALRSIIKWMLYRLEPA
jgi:hypothetical protein